MFDILKLATLSEYLWVLSISGQLWPWIMEVCCILTHIKDGKFAFLTFVCLLFISIYHCCFFWARKCVIVTKKVHVQGRRSGWTLLQVTTKKGREIIIMMNSWNKLQLPNSNCGFLTLAALIILSLNCQNCDLARPSLWIRQLQHSQLWLHKQIVW